MSKSRNTPVKAQHPQSVFKTPTSYEPIKPSPNRHERMSMDLGFDYNGADGYDSLSSGDEEDQQPGIASNTSALSVQYQALKRQAKHMESERDQLLLKISKLKEKAKHAERQLNKSESDRKNQLNIMKNTHEQATHEKAKLIQLYESIVREQECELDELRKMSRANGLGTCVDYPNNQVGVTITRLTTHLNQVVNEKNDILAQFCSQQQLIKDQQAELKVLMRCKTENADLKGQIAGLSKSIITLRRQVESEKAKLDKLESERSNLNSELEDLRKSAESSLTKQAAHKLEDQITKLEDRLLLREAEYAEMNLKYKQELQTSENSVMEKDKEIRQLKQEVYHFKSQSPQVVEKVKEVRVESQEAKTKLAESQMLVESLTKELQQLRTEHEQKTRLLTNAHKSELTKLAAELEAAKKYGDDVNKTIEMRNQSDTQRDKHHQEAVEELERQLKQKKAELSKLRQEMANSIAELELKRDADLEQLEAKLRTQMSDAVQENENLKQKVGLITPKLSTMKNDYEQMRKLLSQLQSFSITQCQEVSRKISKSIHDTNEQNKDLVRKYRKEMALRKKYHNELVELRGNIRVFCRIRPVIKEDGAVASMVLSVDADDEDVLVVANSKGRNQSFEMDKLFTSQVSQARVFDEVKAIVTSCVDGYHVCIFAYGQTGSGKTYTMEGPTTDPGINQRALAQLFEEAEDRSKDWQYSIRVSVIEIYNEMVRDLLSNSADQKLDIKLNPEGNLHVPGLTWVSVQSLQDVNRTFATGHKNRATACTNMNEHSSRSHALLCVEVIGTNKTTGAKTLGKLNLVDLAGSERVSKSGADGARLKEAQAINKSLSALGDVIAALRSKQNFVPYRNSKLTYLLQDSLGGDSKVLMIVQVAPIEKHVNETLCSLNFAQRVKSVELGVAGRKVESAEMSALKERLAQYEGQSPIVGTPTKGTITPQGTPVRRK